MVYGTGIEERDRYRAAGYPVPTTVPLVMWLAAAGALLVAGGLCYLAGPGICLQIGWCTHAPWRTPTTPLSLAQ
jgi:hypothetical protein